MVLSCASGPSQAGSDPLTRAQLYDPPVWDSAGSHPVTAWLHPGAWTPGQGWGWFDGNVNARNVTGSWGDRRDRLELGGISIGAAYLGQFAANPIGGQTEGGASFVNDFNLSLYADLERLFDIDQQLFFLASMDLRMGNSGLTPKYVGNFFPVQIHATASSSTELRLVNLALGARLFDDTIELVGGRLLAGSDFATLTRACTSLNQALCAYPFAGKSNISFPGYPDAAWGARIKYQKSASWFAQGGAYLVYPGLFDDGNHGVEFGAPSGSGVLMMAEAGMHVGKTAGQPGLPGTYRLGGYYDTERLTNLETGAGQRNTWGIYAMGEQMVYSENQADDQGLWVWLALSYAPPDVNEIEFMAAGGLSYTGLIPNRPDDTVSLVAVTGVFSDRLADQSAETIFEVNYRAQILPALFVEPDIQYVINPDGYSDVDDALVVGFTIGSKF